MVDWDEGDEPVLRSVWGLVVGTGLDAGSPHTCARHAPCVWKTDWAMPLLGQASRTPAREKPLFVCSAGSKMRYSRPSRVFKRLGRAAREVVVDWDEGDEPVLV